MRKRGCLMLTIAVLLQSVPTPTVSTGGSMARGGGSWVQFGGDDAFSPKAPVEAAYSDPFAELLSGGLAATAGVARP